MPVDVNWTWKHVGLTNVDWIFGSKPFLYSRTRITTSFVYKQTCFPLQKKLRQVLVGLYARVASWGYPADLLNSGTLLPAHFLLVWVYLMNSGWRRRRVWSWEPTVFEQGWPSRDWERSIAWATAVLFVDTADQFIVSSLATTLERDSRLSCKLTLIDLSQLSEYVLKPRYSSFGQIRNRAGNNGVETSIWSKRSINSRNCILRPIVIIPFSLLRSK
jgi:hypothetical protein